jgi:hypothetical protein
VKATLFVLATWASADGSGAFPSQETIATAMGKKQRAVRGHLRTAEEAGWLIRSRRGKGRTTRYFLSVPDRQPSAGHGERDGRDNRQPAAALTGSPLPPTTTATTTGEDAFGVFPEDDTPHEEDAVTPEGRSGSKESDVFHETPAVEDDGLIATLRSLSAETRDRTAAEWKRPGGPEVVRYCIERATAPDGLDEDRLVRLLDDPYEVFLIHSGEFPDDRLDVYRGYVEAKDAIESHRAAGRPAALSVAKADEAVFHLEGEAA